MHIPTKICNKCKEEKPLYEYGKDSRSKDQKNRTCMKCTRSRNYISEIEKLRRKSTTTRNYSKSHGINFDKYDL